MPVTYDDLGDKQRCIYDAFSKATGLEGRALAAHVNAAGVDADDTEAVLILAKKYGFNQTPRGTTGKNFKTTLANLDEETSFIVLVCTGMGNSMVPSKSASGASFKYDFETGFDARPMLESSAFDNILWHAIYILGKVGSNVTAVHDPQKLRPTGPVDGDRIIWFAK